ncbi:ABC-type transporter, integral membrane subunit [halophilic archaeon DL31]|jgi:putative spermidine/putrescine transport system permease protein|nr:ABC-type transporter, integral membrane subunit [halophilic archaeon DL31]
MSGEDIGREKQFRLSQILDKIDLSKSLGGVSISQAMYAVLLSTMFLYLLLPVLFAMIISINPSDLYAFPPDGFTLQWYAEVFERRTWVSSFIVSFQYSLIATAIAIVLSTAAAYAIGRFDFRYRNLLDAATFLPLMIPQIILGLALLLFLKNFALVGNLWGLSLALAVYATPYATRSILTTMYNFDRSIEEAAMNLGADEIQTFLRITFPALLPGLLTAAVFSFVVSYSNLQIAVFLQGAGFTPIPVRIFAQMQFGASPVIAAVATINIFIVLLAIVVVERIFGAAEALGYN